MAEARAWVLVTIPGDVNGDFRVQYLDLGKLLAVYGSSPSNPKHSANCDVNSDNVINYKDLGHILAHYGEHYP